MYRTVIYSAVSIVMLAISPCGAMPEIDFEVPEKQPAIVKHDPDDVVVDLDMSCPRECVPANMAFQAEKYSRPTIRIAEGDDVRSVSKNCMLTASEYFAARQIMRDEQKLELTSVGTASKGTVYLDKYTAEHCRNLYVPRRVLAIQDAAVVPDVVLAGELHIAGTYQVQGVAARSMVKAKRIKLCLDGCIASSGDVKVLSVLAPKIETSLIAEVSGSAGKYTRDTIYSKDKAGKRNIEAISNRDYEVQKVETTLLKANDEFIPAEGTENAVEIGLIRQQRESCQRKDSR
jgi:hypothetical protein